MRGVASLGRVVLRPLGDGELDHERLWTGVFALGVFVAFATPPWLVSRLFCPLKAATGVPCPTCGSTRAVQALMHFDIAAAFQLNPLTTLALGAWALFALYGAVVVIARLPRLRWSGRDLGRPLALGVGAALVVNWAYVLLARGGA
jgi:hypothetical protein